MLIVLGVIIVGMFGIAGTFLSIEAKQRKQGNSAKSSETSSDRQALPDTHSRS